MNSSGDSNLDETLNMKGAIAPVLFLFIFPILGILITERLFFRANK